MKKILFAIIILLLFASNTIAYADTDGAFPKLIVEDYVVEETTLTPGESANITIFIRNTHSSRSVRNIRFSFMDSSNEILPVKTSSMICSYIGTDKVFEWELEVYATETAKDAPHILNITMEYEDKRGNQLRAEDIIIINVVQAVRLKYTEPELPPRVTEGDTFAFSMTLMNMGKGDIFNALLSFDIKGIVNGGSVLVGTLKEGESKEGKTNFRVNSDKIGEVSGNITLSYEDSRGKYYSSVIPISTFVQEKVMQKTVESSDNINTEDNFPWKTLAIVCSSVSIILLIFSFIALIKSKKIRREYEMKL